MTDWTATELGEIITEIAGIVRKIQRGTETERTKKVQDLLTDAMANLQQAKEAYEG